MNLIDRIQHALDDPKLLIDPSVFEECATDLLSQAYPALVPIRGGADSGRDADVLRDVREPPIRVAITSSRTYEGARRNLQNSIESLTQHGIKGTSVLSVSLAELNQAKRKKLEILASERGFELVGIFDRAYFAQRLRVAGDWRPRLLRLPGGPFSLSKTSGHFVLDQQTDELVGREQLIELLSDLNSDAIVWGAPGAGKSSVLERVPGLLFVEGQPTAERLQDDILAAGARIFVVDDASRRLSLLDLLLQIRKQESLQYEVIAVCWPHEREAIGVHLPHAREVEVELLTRRQIAGIVKAADVTSTLTLGRILDQARGRPGWAVRLAELMRKDTEWRSVYSGEALRGEIKTYLLRAGLPQESLHLLAVVGLLGSIAESELAHLAAVLNLPRTQLAKTINDVAVGGLLDVHRISGARIGSENSYSVAPEVLAVSIVGGVLFGDEVPPISAEELFEQWPSKRLSIATTAIQTVLLGNPTALRHARAFFADVIDAPDVLGDREKLLHHYLHLGEIEAREVLDRLIGDRAIGERKMSKPELESSAKKLVSFTSEAVVSVGVIAAVDDILGVAASLTGQGTVVDEILKEFVDEVRNFGPDGRLNVALVVDVWERGAQWGAENGHEHSGLVLVKLLRECMRPSFDTTWLSPEGARTVVMASGTLTRPDMVFLQERIWESFERLDAVLAREEVATIVQIVRDWGHIAGGFLSAFGGKPTPEQVTGATSVTLRIAVWALTRCARYPGLRASLRINVERLGLPIPEDDQLIEALFDTRGHGDNWRDWSEAHRTRLTQLLTPRIASDPEGLCGFLGSMKAELESIRPWSSSDPLRTALGIVNETITDRRAWLKLAREHDLFPEANVLLSQALRDEDYDPRFVRDLMREPRSRGAIVAEAVSQEASSSLFRLVAEDLTADDVSEVQLAVHRELSADSAIRALLVHSSPSVRAATAAALLDSFDEEGVLPPDEDWRNAIRELRIPLDFKLYNDHVFPEKLLKQAPDIYEELLLNVIRVPEADFDWRALDLFEDTASSLPLDAKTRIWSAIPSAYWRAIVFRLLAGSEIDWIESLLDSGAVEAEFVLGTVTGLGKSPSLEDLAQLLVPRGVNPATIAATAQFGIFTGEQHEVISGYLSNSENMVNSPDPAISAVGRAGLGYFAPLHEQAVQRARQKEISGEL